MSVLDSFRLDGRTALVTGASRGLGAALAVALTEAGADLLLVARGDCAEALAAAKAAGRRAAALSVDLGAPGAAAQVVEWAAQQGGADILVNNAGIIRRHNALDFPLSDWDEVMNINLRVAFELSQGLARTWVAAAKPGRIINIASMLSFQGGVRVPAYTAAKSGLLGLTRALANELASKNITVNAIAPGYMATDNTAPLRADEARAKSILERIPAGRWGEASDLAGAIVFLASPASAYVQGAVLPVDGGWLAR